MLLRSELPRVVDQFDDTWQEGLPTDCLFYQNVIFEGDGNPVSSGARDESAQNGLRPIPSEFTLLDKPFVELLRKSDADFRTANLIAPEAKTKHQILVRHGYGNANRRFDRAKVIINKPSSAAFASIGLRRGIPHLDGLEAHILDINMSFYNIASFVTTEFFKGNYIVPSGERRRDVARRGRALFAQTIGRNHWEALPNQLLQHGPTSVHRAPALSAEQVSDRYFAADIVTELS